MYFKLDGCDTSQQYCSENRKLNWHLGDLGVYPVLTLIAWKVICFHCVSVVTWTKRHLQSSSDIAELIHKLQSIQGQRSKQSLALKEYTTRSFYNLEQPNCLCLATKFPYGPQINQIPYLIVFDGVVTQTLSLSKPLRNFFCNLIWVNNRKICQISLNLWNGLRAVHLFQPCTAFLLRAVTVFMVNRSCWDKIIILLLISHNIELLRSQNRVKYSLLRAKTSAMLNGCVWNFY